MHLAFRRGAPWLLLPLLLAAWPLRGAHATRVVHAPHVDVLYDDPALAGYAQRIASDAETQLREVARLFGRAPFPIHLRLQSGDDVFNAFALPIPRPHVTFRPLFPIRGTVGFHSRDLTELVVRHEITHLVQLTDTRVPPGTSSLPRLGLVGSGTAVLPPAWLLEGIATWVESNGGLGGRLHDARTRALLWTLARQGSMPSLADVSLISYARWPGGRARYLLGASFIDHLVHEHGFDALLEALHRFQSGMALLPFDQAWKRAVGTDLEQEWASWTAGLRAQAEARSGLGLPTGLAPASPTLGAPARSPDGRTLAWPAADGVRLARWSDGALHHGRTLPTRQVAESLTWLDATTVVMAAVGRDPGRYPSDLFALDVTSGRVRRLTDGAHAHLPRADGRGCVLYVRDVVPAGAALRRWCPGGRDRALWLAPPGDHIVGLAVSAGGREALSVYHPGGVDLALLEDGRLRWLTADRSSELSPRWDGEDALVYAADGSGLFQLYRLAVPEVGAAAGGRAAGAAGSGRGGTPTLRRGTPSGPLTAALGGAELPLPLGGGLLYRTLHGDGFVLAWSKASAAPSSSRSPSPDAAFAAPAPRRGAAAVAGGAPAGRWGARPQPAAGWPVRPHGDVLAAAGSARGRPSPGGSDRPYPDRPYSPWPSLLPFGWWPSGGRLSLRPLGAGLELTAVGLDDSARYALDATVGYDSGLRGPLAGGYGYLRFAWNMPNRVQAPGPPAPFGVALRAGAWPHRAYLEPVTETAYGVGLETLLQAPVGRYRGALAVAGALVGAPSLPGWRPEGGVDAVLDGRTGDRFGAVSGGELFALRARWSYGAGGASAGAWGEARWWPAAALPLALQPELALSAGYRPAPPVPVALPELAAVASLGARLSLPVGLRIGDGLAALDRLDITPTLRLWAGASPAPGAAARMRAGIGGDVAVWANTVLDYDGLARVGVRGGYADGWWIGLGLGLPY